MLKRIKYFNTDTQQWETVAVCDKGEKGDRGEQGPKGDKGEKGEDGYTPIKGVDYFDGEQGPKGDKGDKGEDGYTPVKGVDYFDGAPGTTDYNQLENLPNLDEKISSNTINSIEVVPELPAEGEWTEGVLYIVIPNEGDE